MFSTAALEAKRAARPAWLKRLILAGWIVLGLGAGTGMAGSVFFLAYVVVAELLN